MASSEAATLLSCRLWCPTGPVRERDKQAGKTLNFLTVTLAWDAFIKVTNCIAFVTHLQRPEPPIHGMPPDLNTTRFRLCRSRTRTLFLSSYVHAARPPDKPSFHGSQRFYMLRKRSSKIEPGSPPEHPTGSLSAAFTLISELHPMVYEHNIRDHALFLRDQRDMSTYLLPILALPYYMIHSQQRLVAKAQRCADSFKEDDPCG